MTVMRYVVPSSSSVSLTSILSVVLLPVSPGQLVLKYETVYEVAVTSSASVQEMVIVVVETEPTDRNNTSDREKENINLASVYAVGPDILHMRN